MCDTNCLKLFLHRPSAEQFEILLSLQEIRGPLRIQQWDGVSYPYLRNLRIIGGENASTITLNCGGSLSKHNILISVVGSLFWTNPATVAF